MSRPIAKGNVGKFRTRCRLLEVPVLFTVHAYRTLGTIGRRSRKNRSFRDQASTLEPVGQQLPVAGYGCPDAEAELSPCDLALLLRRAAASSRIF